MSVTSNNPEWVRQFVPVRPRPTSVESRTVVTSEITFGTVNSTYRFQWWSGSEVGLLVCLRGTHSRQSWNVGVEDIRSLVHTGRRLRRIALAFGGTFGPTTEIQWVDRSAGY